MIGLKTIPMNVEEIERLKQYEEKPNEKKEKKGIVVKPAITISSNGHE